VSAILIIGGLDPTGGAGVLRDAWTIEARAGMAELHVIVAVLTVQGRGRPASGYPIARAQLERELGHADTRELAAVKLGVLADDHVESLAPMLARWRARGTAVVLDPVMRASDGGTIGASPAALHALAEHVDLITPNPAELAALAPLGPLPCAVLAKSEASEPDRVRDRLILPAGREQVFERPRVPGPDPRGTGCALASAIACELARRLEPGVACARAIAWLDQARARLVLGPDGRWQLAAE
jgi:hydroxymethylpyrimidine/phosphomethylpyrimidine kinase